MSKFHLTKCVGTLEPNSTKENYSSNFVVRHILTFEEASYEVEVGSSAPTIILFDKNLTFLSVKKAHLNFYLFLKFILLEVSKRYYLKLYDSVLYCIYWCPVLYILVSCTVYIGVLYCIYWCPALYILVSCTVYVGVLYCIYWCPVSYILVSCTVYIGVLYCIYWCSVLYIFVLYILVSYTIYIGVLYCIYWCPILYILVSCTVYIGVL